MTAGWGTGGDCLPHLVRVLQSLANSRRLKTCLTAKKPRCHQHFCCLSSLWDVSRDVIKSEQLLRGDLPDDQESLVERNGCEVEYRGEDSLYKGARGCHGESQHSPYPANAICPVQGFLQPSRLP